MKKKIYLPRICENTLEKMLKLSGCVWIQGPKWCGKTTTAKLFAKSIINMHDENKIISNKLLAERNPNEFLNKTPPLLIDEWQEIPFIWNSIRYQIDERENNKGQFIITGSTLPLSNTSLKHSGLGRINRMIMRPLSLYESQDSKGFISLSDLFDNKLENAFYDFDISLEEIAFFICRGGWPESVLQEKQSDALFLTRQYYNNLIKTDIILNSNKKENKSNFVHAIIKSYSRNCASQSASLTTLKKDIGKFENINISDQTINRYLQKLKDVFIIEEMESWSPKLRSKSVVRNSKNKYLMDPSIAASALNVNPNNLINDLNTFGILFENMCVRDLRIYVEKLDGQVFHYRDKNGLEIDSIIVLPDGRYALVEIKLGSTEGIESAAKNLKNLENILDTTYLSKPSFLMILTAGNTSYQREDNIYVVPITLLKD